MRSFETENYLVYIFKSINHEAHYRFYRIRMFLRNFLWFSRDYSRYKKLSRRAGTTSPLYFYPQLNDKTETHNFDAHYLYQGIWAYKKILKQEPLEHVDVGSQYEFLAYLSSITRVTFVDIRRVESDFKNIQFKYGTILKLPYLDNSLNSVSCLHVAEHIGLGRYGDPLDPNGTMLAAKELQRVLAPGGLLYFSLPTGRPATYFNAHRVHSPDMIVKYFNQLELVELSGVLDDRRFVQNIDSVVLANARFSLGMYLFTKK